MDKDSDSCFIKSASDKGSFSRFTVNFENGLLPLEGTDEVSCSMYMDKHNAENHIVVVSVKDRILTGKADSSSLCQTMLLIRNKRTNKAKIIPIPTSILSKPIGKRKHSENVTGNTSLHERRTNILALTRTFGSKRSKRQSEIGLKFDKNVGDNTAEINQTVSGLSINQSELKDFFENSKELTGLLPPCNRNATILSDVYKVDDFLNEVELNSLKEIAQSKIDNSSSLSESDNGFLSLIMKRLGNSITLQNIKLLIYADCLLKFIKMSAKELRKKQIAGIICPFSNPIGRKIVKEFTVGSENGRTRPISMKDKVLSYVMVLMLLACDYSMNMDILSSSLKGISQKKLKQLARAVGLVPKSSLNSQVYILNLPLPPLPAISNNRRKTM